MIRSKWVRVLRKDHEQTKELERDYFSTRPHRRPARRMRWQAHADWRIFFKTHDPLGGG